MSAYRILFLSDDCDETANWVGDLAWPETEFHLSTDGEAAIPIHAIRSFCLLVLDTHASSAADEPQQHRRDILQLCRYLRGQTTQPILLLSPLANEDYAIEAYIIGVDEYVIKPISLSLLVAKLQAWQRWSIRKEPAQVIISIRSMDRLA